MAGHCLAPVLPLPQPCLRGEGRGEREVLSDLLYLSYFPHASGSGNCVSRLLQLAIITVQMLSSNFLILFSFFNSVGERRGVRLCCCSETKLQKEHRSREGREGKNILKSMQPYKGMWFHRSPRTQDRDVESSTDPNFPEHWGCSEPLV